MDSIWIKGGLVYTGGDSPRVIQGGVLCRGDNIEAVGSDDELGNMADGAQVVNAGGRLIVPGFINAHMHLYSTLARGMSLQGPPPENFIQILERLWWRLDKALELDDLIPSAQLPLADALLSGVTTVIDHHASPNAISGSLDVLADEAAKLGVRFSTCYEVSDRDGPETMKAGIEENLRFAKRASSDPMLAATFGLHASFTLSDESLDECAQAVQDAGLPVHVHVAEALSDARDSVDRGYEGPLARLHSLGVLPEGSLAVHCVHTNEHEWEIMSQADIYCVHNPQSNMNNSVGATRVAEMIGAGVNVGVGTDGMQADVRQDIRAAFLLGHHGTGDPRTMWSETGDLLSTNRRIASGLFGKNLGVLEPGAAADVVVYDYFPPTELNVENFLGHLLFGLYQARADAVVVAGVMRVSNGEILGYDAAGASDIARQKASLLWRRV